MKRLSIFALATLVFSLTGCGLMKATGIMKDAPPNTTVTMKSSGFRRGPQPLFER